jgi:hypothetical protein
VSVAVGDVVVALRNGGHDKLNRPVQRPILGRTYRIASIYEMKYGLGCTLEGMDPSPYRGYFLWVRAGIKMKATRELTAGWYFELAPVKDDWLERTLAAWKEGVK